MSQRLERLAEELAKAKRKQEEINTRVDDLQKKYIETENTEIQNLVRNADISVDDLKALLDARKNGINPVIYPVIKEQGGQDSADGGDDSEAESDSRSRNIYSYESKGDDGTDEADEI